MKTRVISGAVVFVILGLLFILGGPVFLLGLLLLSLGGLYELHVTLRRASSQQEKKSGEVHPYLYVLMGLSVLLYLWMLLGPYFLWERHGLLIFLAAAFMILMGISVALYPGRSYQDALLSFFMLFYVPVLFLFAYAVRSKTGGVYLIWFVMAASWGADTLAYFSGRYLGKHKLIPKVSPHKTVEGAIGGIAGSILLCVLYGTIIAAPGGFDRGRMLLCSLLIGFFGAVASNFGDLFASVIKRTHRVKDYSNLIPGHGGIMDRFDSFLFVAPVVYILTDLFL